MPPSHFGPVSLSSVSLCLTRSCPWFTLFVLLSLLSLSVSLSLSLSLFQSLPVSLGLFPPSLSVGLLSPLYHPWSCPSLRVSRSVLQDPSREGVGGRVRGLPSVRDGRGRDDLGVVCPGQGRDGTRVRRVLRRQTPCVMVVHDGKGTYLHPGPPVGTYRHTQTRVKRHVWSSSYLFLGVCVSEPFVRRGRPGWRRR